MSQLIFFGADQYSEIVLKQLIESQVFDQISLITDRGKPKDRDQKVEPNPTEKLAVVHNLKVIYYPPNLEELNTIIGRETVGLCTSFDHLVPAELIELFGNKLYNLHPSLLPQYRNVAPIQYAIALGDIETGITLFKISTGIDNGEIVGQVQETILRDDTTSTLSARLFHKGAELFLELVKNNLKPSPFIAPTSSGPLIFTKRLSRDSGYLEWTTCKKLISGESLAEGEVVNRLLQLRQKYHPETAKTALADLLRALSPWPGVWTIAPTKKGDLRLSIASVTPELTVKLAGKPNAVTWDQFSTNYLDA